MGNVATVYQRVLALANKEQRGYITPQEFNTFATQAQKESYFTYDLKDSDTEWTYKPRKKSDQVLGEYTGWFKGL